jgi:hypothetical protein
MAGVCLLEARRVHDFANYFSGSNRGGMQAEKKSSKTVPPFCAKQSQIEAHSFRAGHSAAAD